MYLIGGVGVGPVRAGPPHRWRRSAARSQGLNGLVSGNFSESVKLSEPVSVVVRIDLAAIIQVIESLYVFGCSRPGAARHVPWSADEGGRPGAGRSCA